MRAVFITGNADDVSIRSGVKRLLDEYNPDCVITEGRAGAGFYGRAWCREHNKPQINITIGPRKPDYSEYSEWNKALLDAMADKEVVLIIAVRGARWPVVVKLNVPVVELNERPHSLDDYRI